MLFGRLYVISERPPEGLRSPHLVRPLPVQGWPPHHAVPEAPSDAGLPILGLAWGEGSLRHRWVPSRPGCVQGPCQGAAQSTLKLPGQWRPPPPRRCTESPGERQHPTVCRAPEPCVLAVGGCGGLHAAG